MIYYHFNIPTIGPFCWADTHMSKDIDVMEKVQRRATRMVPELKHLKYEDRLKKLEIYHLSARRLTGDLIETYNINY